MSTSSPAPDLPSLPPLLERILERSLSRLDRVREELDELTRLYSEREDLPGVKTLVEAMRLVVSEAERDIAREAREAHRGLARDGAAGEDLTNAAGSSSAAGGPTEPGRLPPNGQPDSAEQPTLRFRDRVGGLIASLELMLPRTLEVARAPHGREIEPLVASFSRLAREISSGRELIFEPGELYQFQDSLVEDMQPHARVFSRRLRAALDALPHLTVVTYPAQLDADTLLHLAVVHEISHLAYEKVLPGDVAPAARLLISRSIDDSFVALRNEVYTTERGVSLHVAEEAESLDDLLYETTDRLKAWFEELACDTLALHLAGPGYLFALADIELPANRWAEEPGMEGYDTHPGLSWRLTRLIDQAREMLAPPATGDSWRAAHDVLEELRNLIPDETDELGMVQREIIDTALAGLTERLIMDVLGLARYDLGTFRRDLPTVWNKLRSGIPPAERILDRSRPETSSSHGALAVSDLDAASPWSEPLDWRTIMNGCYVYWLNGGARSPEPRVRWLPMHAGGLEDWKHFNAHVRGTLELAEIHRSLDEMRNALGGLNFPERV